VSDVTFWWGSQLGLVGRASVVLCRAVNKILIISRSNVASWNDACPLKLSNYYYLRYSVNEWPDKHFPLTAEFEIRFPCTRRLFPNPQF
jgi:hypothetical protein